MTPEAAEATELAFHFGNTEQERPRPTTVEPIGSGGGLGSLREPEMGEGSPSDVEAPPWLVIIDRLVARLSGEPEVGPSQLLAEVVRGAGARGGAMIDVDGGSEVAMRTAWGRISPRDTRDALARCLDLLRRHETGWPLVVPFEKGPNRPDRPERGIMVGDRLPGGATRWLILFGGLPGIDQDPRPLRTVRHLLHLRIEATDGSRRNGSAARRAAVRVVDQDRGLRLPEGHLSGRSPGMVALYRELAGVAPLDDSVLITGETGVGKEHVARIVALNSSRNHPFVAINCAAIPEQLLEAEMFGIGDRVATGVAGRRGWFAEARGGTLFLDEIGEMDPRLQAKLLRAIERHRVQAVGGAEVTIDVRIVAATNVDLHQRIEEGAFRADLYYRLARHELVVPPLRRRIEDLPALLERFVADAVRRSGKRVRGLTVGTFDLLSLYPWPGNVRELENEAYRLVRSCPDGGVIEAGMLSPRILGDRGVAHVVGGAEPPTSSSGPRRVTLKDRLFEIERRLVLTALRGARGNQSRAARRLGVHRNTLAVKIKRLRILKEEIGC